MLGYHLLEEGDFELNSNWFGAIDDQPDCIRSKRSIKITI